MDGWEKNTEGRKEEEEEEIEGSDGIGGIEFSRATHVLLLFVHVADLEPYIHLTQWMWRVS